MRPRVIIVLLALVLVCGKLSLAGQQPYPNDPNTKVLSLEEAVNMALADNLSLQTTIDTVSRSQISKGLAESRFDFKLTPSLAGGFGSEIGRDRVFGFQAAKLLPYGATVTARAQSDYTRNQFGEVTGSLLTFTLAQPLLRGFGRKSVEPDYQPVVLTSMRRPGSRSLIAWRSGRKWIVSTTHVEASPSLARIYCRSSTSTFVTNSRA